MWTALCKRCLLSCWARCQHQAKKDSHVSSKHLPFIIPEHCPFVHHRTVHVSGQCSSANLRSACWDSTPHQVSLFYIRPSYQAGFYRAQSNSPHENGCLQRFLRFYPPVWLWGVDILTQWFLTSFVPQPILSTLYNPTTPYLKLEQSKCSAEVYIKYLLATPPKMVNDLSGGGVENHCPNVTTSDSGIFSYSLPPDNSQGQSTLRTCKELPGVILCLFCCVG